MKSLPSASRAPSAPFNYGKTFDKMQAKTQARPRLSGKEVVGLSVTALLPLQKGTKPEAQKTSTKKMNKIVQGTVVQIRRIAQRFAGRRNQQRSHAELPGKKSITKKGRRRVRFSDEAIENRDGHVAMIMHKMSRRLKQKPRSDTAAMMVGSKTADKALERMVPCAHDHISEVSQGKCSSMELFDRILAVRVEKTEQEDEFIAMIHDLEMLSMMEDEDSAEKLALTEQIAAFRSENQATQDQFQAILSDFEAKLDTAQQISTLTRTVGDLQSKKHQLQADKQELEAEQSAYLAQVEQLSHEVSQAKSQSINVLYSRSLIDDSESHPSDEEESEVSHEGFEVGLQSKASTSPLQDAKQQFDVLPIHEESPVTPDDVRLVEPVENAPMPIYADPTIIITQKEKIVQPGIALSSGESPASEMDDSLRNVDSVEDITRDSVHEPKIAPLQVANTQSLSYQHCCEAAAPHDYSRDSTEKAILRGGLSAAALPPTDCMKLSEIVPNVESPDSPEAILNSCVSTEDRNPPSGELNTVNDCMQSLAVVPSCEESPAPCRSCGTAEDVELRTEHKVERARSLASDQDTTMRRIPGETISVESHVEDLQITVYQLEEERKELKRAYAECTATVVELKRHISVQEDGFAKVIDELATDRQLLLQLTEQYHNAVEKCHQLESELKSLTEQITKLEEEREQLRLGVNQELLRQIETRDERAASKYLRLQQQFQISNALVEELEAEKETMSRETDRELLRQLSERDRKATTERHQLEDMLNSSTVAIEKLTAEKQRMMRDVDLAWQSKVAAHDEIAVTLNRELEETRMMSETLVHHLEVEKSKLTQELASSIETIASLEATVAAKEEVYSRKVRDQGQELRNQLNQTDRLMATIKKFKVSDAEIILSRPTIEQLEMEKEKLMLRYLEYPEKVIQLESVVQAQEERFTEAISINESEMLLALQGNDGEISLLSEQLSALRCKLENLHSVIRVLETENVRLAEDSLVHADRAEQLNEVLTSQNENFLKVIEEKDAKIMVLLQERDLNEVRIRQLTPLENEARLSNATVRTLLTEKEGLVRTISQLSEEMASLKKIRLEQEQIMAASMKDLEDRRVTEQDQLAAKTMRISELEEAVIMLQATVQRLGSERDTLSNDLDEASLMRAQDQQAAELEIAELDDAINRAITIAKQLKADNAALSQDLEEINGVREHDMHFAEISIFELRNIVQQLVAEKDALSKQIEEISYLRVQDQQVTKMNMMELESALRKSRDAAQKLQADNVSLARANILCYDSITLRTNKEEHVAATSEKNGGYTTQADLRVVNKLTGEKEELRRMNSATFDHAAELDTQNKQQLEMLINKLHTQELEAQAEIDELESKCKFIFDQVAELEAQNNEQLSMFMEQLHSKDLELDSITRQRGHLAAMTRELSEQVERLHCELDQLRDQNRLLAQENCSNSE